MNSSLLLEEEILKHIEKLRVELGQIYCKHNGCLESEELIRKSQELDEALIKYKYYIRRGKEIFRNDQH